MSENLNFYNFMNKQILLLLALFVGTGPSFIYIAWLHSSYILETLWYILLLGISAWGYKLHRDYTDNKLTIKQKQKWLHKLQYFLYIYFSMWTVMFVIYTSTNSIELHYIVIATQLGSTVVAATILASQKKLAIFTVISLMLPLTIYFLLVNEFYSYLLAFFTIVLSAVLLHASNNTFNYLSKSRHQAYHDYLTGLGNRRCFIELLESSIEMIKKEKSFVYLLLIDLDHFKTINDSLGHDIGDALLREVAIRMHKSANNHNNSVSRIGGDEFCILSNTYKSEDECTKNAQNFSQELMKLIKATYKISDHHLYISASIGISVINNPKIDAHLFLKEADIAMYEAKNKGRDGVILFTDELSKNVETKLDIERLLHFAIDKNEISLNYQPQNNSKDEIIGCEVLVRWNNERLGAIGPDIFIPISEQSGFIIELGLYILEESFKTLRDWKDRGIDIGTMSINISMRQLFHDTFIDDTKILCDKYLSGNLASKIIFEMTETSVADSINKLVENMNSLKELGFRFSMDDFGTGYSSLSYLSQLPIDELKIDKSFIDELGHTEKSETMVKTILNIARNLDLTVVAEGVEELTQKEFLLEENCDILQGYYFSKPVSKEEFEKYLTA